jgi:hypothetical protein
MIRDLEREGRESKLKVWACSLEERFKKSLTPLPSRVFDCPLQRGFLLPKSAGQEPVESPQCRGTAFVGRS